jgi:hypothetical protein
LDLARPIDALLPPAVASATIETCRLRSERLQAYIAGEGTTYFPEPTIPLPSFMG